MGQPGAGNSNLLFRATFGLGLCISRGFFLRRVDTYVKVIFAFRGLYLTMKAGFEKGSSSGSEDPSEHDLLLGKECMALIYA